MNTNKKIISLVLLFSLVFSLVGGIGAAVDFIAEEPEEPKLLEDFTAESIEYDAIDRFVSRMYLDVLNRGYDIDGLIFWADHIRNGRLSGANFAHSAFFSQEFIGQRVSDAEFINRMYMGLMDRDPDPDGREFWLAHMRAGLPRENIFENFVNSNEFTGHCGRSGIVRGTYTPPPGGLARVFAKRLFTIVLDREPWESELNNWHDLLKNGRTGATVAFELIFGTEAYNRNLNDSQFVDLLYNALLGRIPDPVGRDGWVTYLEEGNSRYILFENFVNSPEFNRICTDHGVIRGIAPQPENLMQGNSMIAKIWNMIVMAGVRGISDRPEHIAGIIGNMQAEAGMGLCPFQQQLSNYVGIGLIQWSFGRRTNLEEFMWERGIDPEEFAFEMNKHIDHVCFTPVATHPPELLDKVLEVQVAFLIHELRNAEFRYMQFIDYPTEKIGMAGAMSYAELFCALLLRPAESLNELDELTDEGVLEALTESIYAGGQGILNRTTYSGLNARRNRAATVLYTFLANQG